MLSRRDRLFPERQNDVLDKEASPRMQVSRVAAKNSQKQDGTQCSPEAGGQQIGHGNGNLQLLLKLGVRNLRHLGMDPGGFNGEFRVLQIGHGADGQ